MPPSSDTLLAFIRRVHATPLNGSWPSPLLEDLSAALGGAFVGVARYIQPPFHAGELVTTHVPKGYREVGASFGPDEAPWFDIGVRHPGELLRLTDHVTPEEIVKHRFHREWMEPQGYLAEAVLGSLHPSSRDDPGFGWMVLGRRPFTDGEIAFCRDLDPHMAQATQVAWRLQLAESLRDAALYALDGSPEGVCLLDREGRVTWSSGAARRTFEGGDGITLDGCTLRGTTARDSARLQKAIGDCLDGTVGSPTLVALARRGTDPPLAVVIDRAVRPESTTHASETVAVVGILDTSRAMLSPEPVLREVYGLTAAEARLAVAIGGGATLADVAKRTRRSTETVRTQLKAVFRKLGVRRQSDVVALVHMAARGPYRLVDGREE